MQIKQIADAVKTHGPLWDRFDDEKNAIMFNIVQQKMDRDFPKEQRDAFIKGLVETNKVKQ